MSGQRAVQAKLSHADARRSLRMRKASRIEQVIGAVCPDLASKNLLDIGTGSGIIASYFRDKVASLRSVDVVDERVERDFSFELMSSERLPVEDASFDVVISNHVIEHVDDQALHLQEIARVLRSEGVCYLATPNLLWPIEPHFRLPFLAWLPGQELQDRYLRVTQRGRRYDVTLLNRGRLRALALGAGLDCRDVTFQMASTVLNERLGVDVAFAKFLWPVISGMTPSLVYLLKPESETGSVAS